MTRNNPFSSNLKLAVLVFFICVFGIVGAVYLADTIDQAPVMLIFSLISMMLIFTLGVKYWSSISMFIDAVVDSWAFSMVKILFQISMFIYLARLIYLAL